MPAASRLLISLFAAFVLVESGTAQSLVRSDPASAGVSSERLERLDEFLSEYVEEGKLPGAVLLVARDGHVVYHKAFGHRDRESGDALAVDDLFRIASQTKALISVGIMMLQERGDLLITDPLSRYIPEFEETTVAVTDGDEGYDVVEAERPITLRHLLTHTSGISYGYGVAADRWEAAGLQGWYFADRDEPIGATVSRMASLPIDAQPGEDWIYGYSTDILGAVLEAASGRPLDEFLQTEIFEPLGMHDTHFYVPREKADRLTVVYSRTSGGELEPAPEPGHMIGQGAYLEGPRESLSGGAGLVSTASDYARFLEMLRRGGELNGRRILSPSTIELMTVDHTGGLFDRPGQGFGLGFYVVDDLGEGGLPGSIGMYGWGGAYHSTYWVDPREELVVSYMTQIIPAPGLDDHSKVRTLVYQALVDAVPAE